jgi:hypothetical protein
MPWVSWISRLAILIAVTGCGSGSTTILQPTNPQNAQNPQTNFRSLSIQAGQSIVAVPPDVANLFASKLENKLYGQTQIARGDDLTLTYDFVNYDEGNRLHRWIAGPSGFGEASISVQAAFVDRSGREVGRVVSVGRLNHGIFGGDADLAVDQAANELVNYTLNSFAITGGKRVEPKMSPRGVAPLPNQPAAGAASAPGAGFAGPIGTEYHDALTVGSVRLPLPEGVWVLAGKGGPSSEYALSLVRIENGRLAGILRVWTAARPVSNGYTSFATCNRKDTVFAAVQSNVDRGDQDCWVINHYDMQHARSTSTQQNMLDSYAFLDNRGIVVPGNMIVGIHRIATPTNFITIWYHVNPELAGFAAPASSVWDQSDWHRDRLALDPKRVSYIEAFKQQQAQYHDLLRRGFAQNLVSSATPDVR